MQRSTTSKNGQSYQQPNRNTGVNMRQQLINIVRHAYVSARQRADSMSGKASNYKPSAKLEGKNGEAYVLFIERCLRQGLNPVQVIFKEVARIASAGYSSDIPWLTSITSLNLYDPRQLQLEFDIKTETTLRTTFELIKTRTELDSLILGSDDNVDILLALAEEKACDPVVLAHMLFDCGISASKDLLTDAKVAYSTSPDIYDRELKKKGITLYGGLYRFDQW